MTIFIENALYTNEWLLVLHRLLTILYLTVFRDDASHISDSSLSCINGNLAIDSGGYVYEQPSRINYIAYGWMLPREAEMVSE